jgi:hypothetical protein
VGGVAAGRERTAAQGDPVAAVGLASDPLRKGDSQQCLPIADCPPAGPWRTSRHSVLKSYFVCVTLSAVNVTAAPSVLGPELS